MLKNHHFIQIASGIEIVLLPARLCTIVGMQACLNMQGDFFVMNIVYTLEKKENLSRTSAISILFIRRDDNDLIPQI